MNTLEDAWKWYRGAKSQVELLRRFASVYWDDLPWAGKLGGDDRFKQIESENLREEADFTLVQMDDLAVLVLFSVFESQVRNRLATELRTEVGEKALSHPVLLQAFEDLIQQVEEGSFFKGLGPYKSLNADLVEEVNQVRRYRNWVAHGRRGKKPPGVDPRTAYERLNRFWNLLSNQSTESNSVHAT
jgi:hypothetical protein